MRWSRAFSSAIAACDASEPAASRCSSSNLSPWNRVSVYLSLCAVSNHIRRFKRPEYIAHRDFTPIRTLPDDCLLKPYPVDLPWKDGTPESALKTEMAA